jgi:hypothetical protein
MVRKPNLYQKNTPTSKHSSLPNAYTALISVDAMKKTLGIFKTTNPQNQLNLIANSA